MTESNTGFEGLGIEPTGDTRAVKRAYAAILKTIDLAKDPGLFAQLRSDYQAALNWADALNNSVAAPLRPDTAAEGAQIPELTSASKDVQLHPLFNGTREELGAVDNGDPAQSARPVPPTVRGLSAPLTARRADAAFAVDLDDSDQAERVAIGRLLDPTTLHRHRVLEEGLRRFGWDMHATTDFELFGNARSWFMLVLVERRRWLDLGAEERLRIETLLARTASRAPSGAMDAVKTWEALASTVESFPLWTKLVSGPEHLDRWHQACAAVPPWKRKLLLHRKTLTVGSVACLALVAILAAVVRTLNDHSAPEWAVALAHGTVLLTGIGEGLLVFALTVGRGSKHRRSRAPLVPLVVVLTAHVSHLVVPVIEPVLTAGAVIGVGIAICVLFTKVLFTKVRSLRKSLSR